MSDIRTLTQARERIAELESQAADLSARAQEADSLRSQLNQAQARSAELEAAAETARQERDAARAQAQQAQSALQAAQTERDQARSQAQGLEANQRTVEARARELLAAQGGRALAIADAGEGPGGESTLEEVRAQMAVEKDPAKLGRLAEKARQLRTKK